MEWLFRTPDVFGFTKNPRENGTQSPEIRVQRSQNSLAKALRAAGKRNLERYLAKVA